MAAPRFRNNARSNTNRSIVFVERSKSESRASAPLARAPSRRRRRSTRRDRARPRARRVDARTDARRRRGGRLRGRGALRVSHRPGCRVVVDGARPSEATPKGRRDVRRHGHGRRREGRRRRRLQGVDGRYVRREGRGERRRVVRARRGQRGRQGAVRAHALARDVAREDLLLRRPQSPRADVARGDALHVRDDDRAHGRVLVRPARHDDRAVEQGQGGVLRGHLQVPRRHRNRGAALRECTSTSKTSSRWSGGCG